MNPRLLPVAGAVVGLAWAGALRGYMVAFAGSASRFDMVGTFAQILLPGVVIGALLGWAEVIRRRGGAPRWRLLALSPVLFAVAPMLTPGALWTLLTTGLGGGAVGVAVIGLLGGFALGDIGRRTLRIVAGVLAAALAAGIAVAPLFVGTGPREIWGVALGASLMPILIWACAIPFRRVVAATT
jgi:hypothetical protein